MTARHRSPQGELRLRGRGSEEEPTVFSATVFVRDPREDKDTGLQLALLFYY